MNIDAAKAFDSILRHKLIEILLEKNMDKRLVRAIANTLQGTFMKVEEKTFETHMGVPQGSILSPILFNITVNHLLTEEVMKCQPLGYSDDLSVIVEG